MVHTANHAAQQLVIGIASDFHAWQAVKSSASQSDFSFARNGRDSFAAHGADRIDARCAVGRNVAGQGRNCDQHQRHGDES